MLSAAGVAGLTVPEPQPSLQAGYYYPDLDAAAGGAGGAAGRVFADWDAFDAWRRAAGKHRPGAPRVAVGFYGSNYDDGDTALIDAVIAEIERQGAEAIPIFGYPAGITFETLLRDADGSARADVALAFLFRFAGPDAGESLRKLDIPVLSLISLYGRSEAEWRDSAQGLSMFEGTFQIAVPELAGLVAPTVVGSKERRTDPDTGLTIVASRPIVPRVTLAVQRALGYAALAATPNADKRVAVLFYNYPPGKAGIGASYLNVADSLANILQRMQAAGYEHKNVQLAEAYADEIRRQAEDLGMVKDLGLELGTGAQIEHDTLHAIEDYLIELRGQDIPYGLHAFGRTPEPEMRASTVDAIVSVDRDLLPNDATVLASDMERRIVESGPRELDHLLHALDGGYVPAGNGGEPIRNPDAYPTGKNFYGIDPDKVPKPAAWTVGVFLADRMLRDHVAEHGRYPEKVSFVIWGTETLRHEGVLESQIFHLLGTRPVWDARGKVVDVEVVPARELGRPRVDIVIASAAEGMFNNVTRLMDEAVQRVKVLDEAENFVRRHYLATRTALIDRGYAEEDADRRAGVRIFDEPPGTYNLNTSRIAAASGTWDSDRPMADEYLSKMGHGYGNGFWGEPMEDVFRLALSGTEKVVHSSSTMLYGALDNDDFFMYMGGLAAAVRSIDGESPQMVVTNTRDPGQPEMTGIDKFLGAEFRTRYVNPTWIEGMQREGYAGAGEMRAFVEYLWGWDATVPETVDDAMWQESFAVYVEDRHDLDLKAFFDEHSPHAYQDITGRMVETVRKGYWAADDATTERLLREHVESVAAHGVGCSEHTCGNPRLLRYVLEQGAMMNIPGPALEAYRAAMEEAIGADIETAAAEAEEFVRWNESRPALTTMNIEGFRMEESADDAEPLPAPPASGSEDGVWTPLWVGAPLVGLLAIWRWRRRV